MLNNRSLKVRIEKDPAPGATTSEPNPYLDPETIIPIIKDLTLSGAKLAGAMYAGARILNTACKIAEIAARAKL